MSFFDKFLPLQPVAERNRDKALERVRKNSGQWFDAALGVIAQLETGWTGIAEDWRYIVRAKIGNPHDPHAWGALTRHAIRYKLVVRMDVPQRKMRDSLSNARKSDVYRRP